MGFLNFSSLVLLLVIFLNIFAQSQCTFFNFTKPSSRSSIELATNDSSHRQARQRTVVSGGLFSLISFNNVPCNGTSGDVGTCYSNAQCNNLAGSMNGHCAGNYGTCCTLMVTCGATITVNNTYFVNPGYPSIVTGPLSCSVTVQQLAGATQFYLDFVTFDIRQPSGQCTNDTFTVTVSGVSTTYPTLCGVNTAKDEYISWGSSSRRRRQTTTGLRTATISFNLANGDDMRSWKIRVVQFKPKDSCAAPAGCLQYFQGTSGTVESYNYNGGNGMVISTGRCTNQCFQLPTGYCSMLLTDPTNSNFMLPGTAPSTCTTDYLSANGQQYCGDTLGTNGMLRVTQTMGASFLTLGFCTGNGTDMDMGYSLMYTLQRC